MKKTLENCKKKLETSEQTLDAVANTTVIGSPPSALCTMSILVVCFHAFFPSSAPRIVPWLEKIATCSPRSAQALSASRASRRKKTKSPGLAGPRDLSRRQEAPSTTRVPSCFVCFRGGGREGAEKGRGLRFREWKERARERKARFAPRALKEKRKRKKKK